MRRRSRRLRPAGADGTIAAMHYDVFSPDNPYPTTRTPLFARNVVATSQPLAAQAGLQMLAAGGNAVDAAVAAAAVIALVEPCSNGLGSDAFALVWDGARLHGLNASGPAPAAWTLDYFRGRYGDAIATDAQARPERGWDTVTVPGAVGGWAALHGRFGALPFERVLAPAIDYAERGFAVSPGVADKWQLAVTRTRLPEQPGFAAFFLPQGRAPRAGERFVPQGAAHSLRRIAETRGEAFYRGELAEAIDAHARAGGGALRAADLAGYRPQWVEPIAADFAGFRLHEIPPNGQGITALMALGMLRHTALADCKVDSAAWYHLQIEALKLAFADVYAQVAEPQAMRVRAAELLDDGYLRERARRIDPKRAQAHAAGTPPRGGTIYLSAADARGMMVSYIQSNYMGFGSGVVVPGTGISLQNRGAGFAFDAAHPNCVAPGKRPFHTIIPAFLTDGDGGARMSFGVMGGNMQPQGHVQTLTRMLLARQQPQAACDAPRFKFMHGLEVEFESGIAPAVLEELIALGHQPRRGDDSYMDFGAGQFIWKLGDDAAADGYVAASDARRDGQAVGF
jgi:gamma-glutamyltranspeptidase/glutathione hydrolase